MILAEQAVFDKTVNNVLYVLREAWRIDFADHESQCIDFSFEREEFVDDNDVVFFKAALSSKKVSLFIAERVTDFFYCGFKQSELCCFFH